MNEKLCKRLRKTAREMTVGMPERMLVSVNHNGSPIRGISNLVNAKKSTRGVYRFLKATIGKGG